MTVARVVHVVSPEPVGATGGVDRHVADLATAQVASGVVSPLVVELGDKGWAATLRSRGIDAVTVGRPRAASVFREVAGIIAAHEADVVHTHGYDADIAGAGAWWADRRRASLVATVHGLIWRPSSNLVKTLVSLAVVSTGADTLVATSSVRRRVLRRWLPGVRVRFVPNGVEGCPTGAVRDHDRPLIGYVGRLSPEKRVDLVLRVCALLGPEIAGLSCDIVGSGPEGVRLAALAEDLGIGDMVRFAGLVDDPTASFAALDVLLLLSDTEGTPRVIAEAMAAHVAVVATAVGGVPDLITDGRDGLLVAPGDAAAAAAATSRLLRDRMLATRLTTSAHGRWSAELTLAQMHRQVLDVYREVIARRGGRSPGRSASPIRSRPARRGRDRAGEAGPRPAG